MKAKAKTTLRKKEFLFWPRKFNGFRYWLCWATVEYHWIGWRYQRFGQVVEIIGKHSPEVEHMEAEQRARELVSDFIDAGAGLRSDAIIFASRAAKLCRDFCIDSADKYNSSPDVAYWGLVVAELDKIWFDHLEKSKLL